MKAEDVHKGLSVSNGEWERVSLSSLYSVKYGKANPRGGGNIPVIGSSGVYAWTDKPLILHPTVVIGRKGSAGQAWLVEVPSYPSDTTFYLEPHDPASTNLKFTYFALRHFQISASDDVIPSLQRHELENVVLPHPPIIEQRAIAGVLAEIQAAVEVQEKIVTKLRELKASTMAKLFREGLRGEPLKQTEIGEIPESWEVTKLGEIATIERGKFAHRPRNDPRFYGGTIPFIQTGDVANCNGRIRTYTQTLNEQGLAISRIFPNGTIVLTIAANIADTGILEFDSAFPDSLVGITPNQTMEAKFLEYFLRTQKADMDRSAPKGTQKNINIQFLKPWPTPRPLLDEQRRIAHSLRSLDDKLEKALTKRDAHKSLFSSMLHLLMTGEIRLPGFRRTLNLDSPWFKSEDVRKFVERLVQKFDPERVILFGSRAWGTPTRDSDVDLLVMMEFEGRPVDMAVRIGAECDDRFPMDLIVRRPAEVQRRIAMGDPFFKQILRDGLVLHERAA